MKKQTVVNVLKEHIQDAIEKTVVDNHYESGYKQCLIDIQNKIDDGLLQMEKEQIIEAFVVHYTGTAEQYYNENYGGQDVEVYSKNNIEKKYNCDYCHDMGAKYIGVPLGHLSCPQCKKY